MRDDILINDNKKDARKYCVLGHIVHSYISSAVPISSKIVAERMEGDISSATVRNTMAELEEEGYIEQPYTSAGRVPTDLGYRQYVNMVKDHIRFEQRESERLAEEYNRKIDTIKEVLVKTSFLISRELQSAGVVLWPGIEDLYLKHIELVKIKPKTILAIIVMMSNDVKNYIVEINRDIQKTELAKIANYINDNYRQSALSYVLKGLKNTVLNISSYGYEHDISQFAKDALFVLDSVVDESDENELYWEGLNYFMEGASSENISVTRNLYRMFSGQGSMARFMRGELPFGGMKVYIGAENENKMLDNCSLITCGYDLGGKTIGRIGVIGPRRMDYGHAMRVVSCLADLISAKLEEINYQRRKDGE